MPELDLTFVDRTVEELGRGPEKVIPILQAVQRHYRYLPQEALRRVCEVSEITPAAIAGVSTFYSQFRHEVMGRHHIKICNGTACHVKGAEGIHDAFKRVLDIPEESDTDEDQEFTVEKVFCLGCCTLAPVIQIDDVTYGHLTRNSVPGVVEDFRRRRDEVRKEKAPGLRTDDGPPGGEIRVCLDSCCLARGCDRTNEALHQAIAESGVAAKVRRVGCTIMCEQTPLLEIAVPGQESVTYARVPPGKTKAIVLRHFRPRGLFRRVQNAISTGLESLLTDEAWEPVTRYASEVRDPPVVAFFGPQKHLATEHYGELDPVSLVEYRARGGFEVLARLLRDRQPERIIDEIAESGLRGRGGAGFPTADKWRIVREAEGEPKYILCNGDEGDPGAFMDRMLLESFPYRVIEGMAIAAYAVGATEGYLYVRAEYPFAVRRMIEALDACADAGLLGPDVLGSGFSLKLHLFEGAGAFVCGEESAMLESLEGRRGIPRLRPPYPAERGLWAKPTLINNVETYALVPWILRDGADRFRSIGTGASKGTKVFALAGKVVRGGLIEVPMGITVREIVEDIGGGMQEDKELKAVLIGGPSGGCVPAEQIDTPIDYESLTELGAIMGSGGVVVLDESDCLVAVARYFLDFCQYESCGKCTFCSIGTRRMLDILDRLCTGQGRKNDLEELETLAGMVQKGSLCGLGKTAPNPVVSSLRHFRDEYEAHLEGHCPAGRCRDLITYSVGDDCVGCTLCAQHCPVEAIPMAPFQKHAIDPDKCTRCDTCRQVCPEDAIEVH